MLTIIRRLKIVIKENILNIILYLWINNQPKINVNGKIEYHELTKTMSEAKK